MKVIDEGDPKDMAIRKWGKESREGEKSQTRVWFCQVLDATWLAGGNSGGCVSFAEQSLATHEVPLSVPERASHVL